MHFTDPQSRKLNKGFTLVELTVSMGILALIVGLTAGILISVVKSYQKQRVISEIERNGDFVMRTVEESLRGGQSLSCVGYDGTSKSPEADGSTICDLGAAQNLLYINYGGLGERYFGRGSGTSPSCASGGNCFVYSLPSRSLIDVSGTPTLTDLSTKMTNDSPVNGIHISRFVVIIRGDAASGQAHNVTVTMDVKGSSGSLSESEARTFQSFLTLRGTYK